MVPAESLPVVLVSAGTEADAAAFITELIDNDVTDEVEGAGAGAGAGAGGARVWRLLNKYYSALVRVRPHLHVPAPACASGTATSAAPACASGTATSAAPAPPCDALVVYLASHECTVETLSRRLRECGAGVGVGVGAGAGTGPAVRLVVCDAAAAPAALTRAAAARGAELVPLHHHHHHDQPAEEEEAAPFREEWGVGRARAALHAHEWRGLERLDRAAPPPPPPDSGEPEPGDSSSENELLSDEEEEVEEDEESMLRRAEQFATLLDALPAARRGGGTAEGRPEQERAERLRRAEALVGAFCRALGPL